MTRTWMLAFAACVVDSAVVWGQDLVPNLPAPPANSPAISLQAPADPGFAKGAEVANAAQVYSIQMIAQGYRGRAK